MSRITFGFVEALNVVGSTLFKDWQDGLGDQCPTHNYGIIFHPKGYELLDFEQQLMLDHALTYLIKHLARDNRFFKLEPVFQCAAPLGNPFKYWPDFYGLRCKNRSLISAQVSLRQQRTMLIYALAIDVGYLYKALNNEPIHFCITSKRPIIDTARFITLMNQMANEGNNRTAIGKHGGKCKFYKMVQARYEYNTAPQLKFGLQVYLDNKTISHAFNSLKERIQANQPHCMSDAARELKLYMDLLEWKWCLVLKFKSGATPIQRQEMVAQLNIFLGTLLGSDFFCLCIFERTGAKGTVEHCNLIIDRRVPESLSAKIARFWSSYETLIPNAALRQFGKMPDGKVTDWSFEIYSAAHLSKYFSKEAGTGLSHYGFVDLSDTKFGPTSRLPHDPKKVRSPKS